MLHVAGSLPFSCLSVTLRLYYVCFFVLFSNIPPHNIIGKYVIHKRISYLVEIKYKDTKKN